VTTVVHRNVVRELHVPKFAAEENTKKILVLQRKWSATAKKGIILGSI